MGVNQTWEIHNNGRGGEKIQSERFQLERKKKLQSSSTGGSTKTLTGHICIRRQADFRMIRIPRREAAPAFGQQKMGEEESV